MVTPVVVYSNKTLEVLPLEYQIITSSSNTIDHPASCLHLEDPRTYWMTCSTSPQTLVLSLKSKALVSHLKIHNKATTSLDIYVGMTHHRRGYLLVRSISSLAHDKTMAIGLGHIPCLYIKVVCTSGSPISMYHISVKGLPATTLHQELGPGLHKVLYQTPRRLLYGRSLELSLDPVVAPAVMDGGGDDTSSYNRRVPRLGCRSTSTRKASTKTKQDTYEEGEEDHQRIAAF